MILIGADPEVFLKNAEGDYVPAIGLIGGTKDAPRFLDHGLGALQEDNVMAEFNIKPAASADEFVHNIQTTMKSLEEIVKPHGLTVDISPSAKFKKKYLEDEKAQEVGCEADYDAYNMRQNPTIELPATIRYAGGHVHVSSKYFGGNPNNRTAFVLAMDATLGLAAKVLDPDTSRRRVYGTLSRYRPKEYPGLEYRTLSNFWLRTPELMEWIYNTVYTVTSAPDVYIRAIHERIRHIRTLYARGTRPQIQRELNRLGFNLPEGE